MCIFMVDHSPFTPITILSPSYYSMLKNASQMSLHQEFKGGLSRYCYNICYKAGTKLGNADALSRLPLPESASCNGITAEMEDLILHLSATSVNSSQIAEWTASDPTLSQVKHYVLTGWPSKPPGKEFIPYFSRKNELTTLNGCILFCSRAVVPPQGQQSVLTELHETHPGVTRMKQLARINVWWPQIKTTIEKLVQNCNTCQQSRPLPAKAPLYPWYWPSEPWTRLHFCRSLPREDVFDSSGRPF